MAKRRKLRLNGMLYGIGEARELCKSILHEWPLHEILVGQEFDIIRDLYGYHPEWDDLKESIEAIKVGITVHASHNRHRAFHVKRFCDRGFTTRPSYLRCFAPGPRPHKSKVTDAMRMAVQDQIDKVRAKAKSSEPGHIHHDGVPFVGLRDEWVFVAGGYDAIEVEYCEEWKTYVMSNPDQLQSWWDHHRKHANLVFMTPEEHSKHHYNRRSTSA